MMEGVGHFSQTRATGSFRRPAKRSRTERKAALFTMSIYGFSPLLPKLPKSSCFSKVVQQGATVPSQLSADDIYCQPHRDFGFESESFVPAIGNRGVFGAHAAIVSLSDCGKG